jgi:hypothetical protein
MIFIVIFPLICYFITYKFFREKFWNAFALSIILLIILLVSIIVISITNPQLGFSLINLGYESGAKGTVGVSLFDPTISSAWGDFAKDLDQMCQKCFTGKYQRPCKETDPDSMCDESRTTYTSYCVYPIDPDARCYCEYTFSSGLRITSDKNKDDIKCEIYLNDKKVEDIDLKYASRLRENIIGNVRLSNKLSIKNNNIIKICCDGVCIEKTYENKCEGF